MFLNFQLTITNQQESTGATGGDDRKQSLAAKANIDTEVVVRDAAGVVRVGTHVGQRSSEEGEEGVWGRDLRGRRLSAERPKPSYTKPDEIWRPCTTRGCTLVYAMESHLCMGCTIEEWRRRLPRIRYAS